MKFALLVHFSYYRTYNGERKWADLTKRNLSLSHTHTRFIQPNQPYKEYMMNKSLGLLISLASKGCYRF